MLFRQLRAIFVHFKKWILRKVPKFLIFPKLSLLQKSVSSLVNHKIKNNCHRDTIESALEPPDNVLSKTFWFMSIKQKEKFLSQFLEAWYLNYYPSWYGTFFIRVASPRCSADLTWNKLLSGTINSYNGYINAAGYVDPRFLKGGKIVNGMHKLGRRPEFV